MTERQILFTADEVRATLDGRKTMFRRPVDPQPAIPDLGVTFPCPFGQLGDLLRLQEATCGGSVRWGVEDGWGCAVLLRLTDVRVERLQRVSAHAMAHKEGIQKHYYLTNAELQGLFVDLWNDRHAANGFGWEANPFVWVGEFERIER